MSLLRRNQLCIELSPQRLDLSLRRNSWRGATTQQLTLPCAPVSPAPWSAALATLGNLLKQEPWSTANVTVILSNHFVRYMLIPWSEMLLRGSEQQAYLQHLFNETYGEMAARYELRLSSAAPGMERIASAIDKALLDELRATVAAAGTGLDSIQPWLMHGFNRHRQKIGRGSGWFVTVEQGVMGIMGMADGAWRLVRIQRCSHHWQRELHTVLERLYLSGDAGNIPRVLYCASTGTGQAEPLFSGDWRLIRLGTEQGGSETGAAAMSAAAG